MIENRIEVPERAAGGSVEIENRIPFARPWCPEPTDPVWSASIEGKAEAVGDDGGRAANDFQAEARASRVWRWSAPVEAGCRLTVTCDYDLVLARRTFDAARWTGLTAETLSELPAGLKAETDRVSASVPSEIAALAKRQITKDRRLVAFVQSASDYLRDEVKWAGDDLAKKPITRHDAPTVLRDHRGWCGPKSALFRAFCLAIGLPAREVSGYALKRVPLIGGEVNMSERRGVPDPAKDGNAHVWAEVYFPRVGWVEVNVATNGDCFDVPETFVGVLGIEAPCVRYRDAKGRQVDYDPFSTRVTVTSR